MMRNELPVCVTIALLACAGPMPTDTSSTDGHGTAPPTLAITATTQVRSLPGGALALEVSAVIRNPTTQRIQISTGASCPLFIKVFEDPGGQYQGSLDASMACPSGTSTIDLGPGESTVLTRTLGAADLASHAPGTYGVTIAVTSSTALIGAWAGAIQLPLVSTP